MVQSLAVSPCMVASKVPHFSPNARLRIDISNTGDVSSTRRDVHVGDNVNFQDDLYDALLNYVGRFGDDGPDGKYSVVNHKVFQEFKYDRFLSDQQEDAHLQFHITRVFTAFSEVAFILEFFTNGTTKQLTNTGLGSLFRNQTFAPNWFRRASPAGLAILSNTSTDVRCAHPIAPGANDANGNYVVDGDPVSRFLTLGLYISTHVILVDVRRKLRLRRPLSL
jgi:hypothetical protein